ncbi:glycoside hydrolase family 55 protein [Desertivirga xinjiangensis]|uniref:glycoside hydrolase family 55 protein n=1 Tax=Desertivirga xinjiangensis TaxID=539206 RepID=UPI0021095FCF|nr:glycoside hydrolase family 55 protein [Pedobacter xinjiangensis]
MIRLFAIAIFTILLPVQAFTQDRNIKVNEVYPAAMFKENGGRFINVKKLVEAGIYSKNAKGDGKNDDSEAIIAAMDWVINRLRRAGQPCGWHEYWHIYFPNGTYLVTKPLVYSGDPVPDCEKHQVSSAREGTAGLKLVGQSRESVIIKLADNLEAFKAGANLPVVSFSRFDRATIFNNAPAGFKFRNFTINTGQGNPGAIGVDFYGANTSRLDNVKIIGGGEIGLHIRIGSAHGYYSNISIEGFRKGIMLEGDTESHPAIEYISIKNSSLATVEVAGMSASLRKIYSSGAPIGLHLKAKGTRLPHAVIVDSEFKTNMGNESIRIDAGSLFVRNMVFRGYKVAVDRQGKAIAVTSPVKEYVSDNVFSSSAIEGRQVKIRSLNIKVEDYPLVAWKPKFSDWANVDQFGAVGDGKTDDLEAVQKAFNSGKKVIYFPRNSYLINGEVKIPASVEQLIGGDARIESAGAKFIIGEASANILLIKDLEFASGSIKHLAKRNLVLESTSSGANPYDSDLKSPGTEVFANNVHGFARFAGVIENVAAYARFINNEKADHFQFNAGKNSLLWIFGFKTEKTFSILKAENGARVEMLGGVLNRFGRDADPDPPGIVNDNSSVSIVACTNGPNRNWNPMIRDIQATEIRDVFMNQFPLRGWDNNIIIPLYFGGNNKK